MGRWIKHCSQKAGIPPVTPQVFRRTAATRLVEAGASDTAIIAFMGHVDIGTARRHYIESRKQLMEMTAKLLE